MRFVYILMSFMHAKLVGTFYMQGCQIILRSTCRHCFYQLQHRVMQGYSMLAFFGECLDLSGIVALNSVVYEYIFILQLYLCGAGLELAPRRINKHMSSYINVIYYTSR